MLPFHERLEGIRLFLISHGMHREANTVREAIRKLSAQSEAAVGASVGAENEELEDKGRKRLAGALIGASQLGLSETECDQLAGVLLGEISLPALLGMDGKLRPIASAAVGAHVGAGADLSKADA